MEERLYTGAKASNVAKTSERPLERITVAADRIERCASLVSEFCDRFHNGGISTVAGVGSGQSTPAGHGGNLVRLFDALDRLENNIATLNQIG